MAYRIISIERIDGRGLKNPLTAGVARWKATVEFWFGKADGPPQLIDDIVIETATQRMRAKPGTDDWELVSKEETLKLALAEVIAEREPVYSALIWAGRRGYLAGLDRADQHGIVSPDDPIAHDRSVRQLIDVIQEESPR